MTALRHLIAIMLLPGVVAGAIPALLLSSTGAHFGWWSLLALPPLAAGLALVVWTIALFATVGRGTLAPWDPTARLVVAGPYRYVRNPMISGVVSILVGEALLFGSVAIAVEAASVFLLNAIYFPLVEEPGLAERFGDDYARYKAAVPRWIPRVRGPRAGGDS